MAMQTDVAITHSTTQTSRNGMPRTYGWTALANGVPTSTATQGIAASTNLNTLPEPNRRPAGAAEEGGDTGAVTMISVSWGADGVERSMTSAIRKSPSEIDCIERLWACQGDGFRALSLQLSCPEPVEGHPTSRALSPSKGTPRTCPEPVEGHPHVHALRQAQGASSD